MSDISLDEATLWQTHHGHDITDSVAFHGPPGTGKTTTAAATVGTLVRDHDYTIGDVAWVTYRRSLARDTLDRLAEWDVISDDQLADPSEGATRYIGTAHAVANRCADIAAEPVEPWQRADFCEKRGIQFWTSEPWNKSAGKQLFRVFDYLANANTTPADTETLHRCPHYDDLQSHWTGNVPDAWADWTDYKAQCNVIDFHEMLQRPLESGARPSRRILVIDEYHDVTQLMHDLFSGWIDDAEIVIVAGDPHQVVNAYDGASPEYFDSLSLPKVLLPKSFRVSDEHWALATTVLANAHTPPDVDTCDSPGLINDYNSARFEYSSEASAWVTYPGESRQGSPAWIVDQYDGSTLFLSRTQMQTDGICRALEAAGIPFKSQQTLRGWNAEGESVRALHNALQKLQGYSPSAMGLTGAAGFDRYQSSNKDPRAVDLTSLEAGILLEAVNARTLSITRSEADDKADALNERGTVGLDTLRDWTKATFWEQYTGGAASVDRLNKSVFPQGDRRRDLVALEQALATQEGPAYPDDIDTWAITIHASKGMEADDVVVYDGVSNRIRSEMQANTRTEQNEYRTWYVALSRPRKRLHIMRGAFEWTSQIVPTNLQQVV